MQDLLSSLVTVATIDPNKKDLDAGTVSSVVITGIVVVFIGLILLIVSVSIYGALFSAAAKKKAKKEQEAQNASNSSENLPKPAPAPVPAPAADPVIEDGIEEETVAVIMAAIACMSASGGKKLVLKSVKTSKPQRSAWSSAGIVENTRPF